MGSSQAFYHWLQEELQGVRDAGLYKAERVITTPQGARVRTANGREVINLCANNYLGLASHPRVPNVVFAPNVAHCWAESGHIQACNEQ